ncbi:Retrovirus-related Pol polyprotein from transposon TNT 1-94 [Gossypium australe]|uniref:Retrovirus-related Pol polyprotein from transposon TNT 1-94 n=1 Tax=Gossypium australe TaxID=47621 RepID=A0A5B6VM09_9ROSI|nr:Retrovirus-related Pol polyprotein from transposon TNT 1-94 [Gossypium australe]
MSIKKYIAKILFTCALIAVAGSRILETEKVENVLTGLLSEFDHVLTLASFSSEPLSLQRLVDVLLEFESRKIRVVQEASLHVHLVEAPSSTMVVDSARGGRPSAGHEIVQCQICGRFGHLAQRCYYRFNRDYGGLMSGARASSSSDFVIQGLGETELCGFGTPYAAVIASMSISDAGLPSMDRTGYVFGPSVGPGPLFGPSNQVGPSSAGPNFGRHFHNVGPSKTLALYEPVLNCVRFGGSIDHGLGFRPIGGGESGLNYGSRIPWMTKPVLVFFLHRHRHVLGCPRRHLGIQIQGLCITSIEKHLP